MMRRQRQHGLQPRVGHQPREGPAQLRQPQRRAEPRRIGQQLRHCPAQQALEQRAAVGLLDMISGVVDEMHVMHARGQVVMQARQPRQRSICFTVLASAGRPASSMSLMR